MRLKPSRSSKASTSPQICGNNTMRLTSPKLHTALTPPTLTLLTLTNSGATMPTATTTTHSTAGSRTASTRSTPSTSSPSAASLTITATRTAVPSPSSARIMTWKRTSRSTLRRGWGRSRAGTWFMFSVNACVGESHKTSQDSPEIKRNYQEIIFCMNINTYRTIHISIVIFS